MDNPCRLFGTWWCLYDYFSHVIGFVVHRQGRERGYLLMALKSGVQVAYITAFESIPLAVELPDLSQFDLRTKTGKEAQELIEMARGFDALSKLAFVLGKNSIKELFA
jgi:hypothetical protein